MAEIVYDIVETIGVVDSGNKTLELNRISWNHRAPVFDLRKWDETHEKMGKGVTMNDSDLRGLYDILREYFENEEE
jgi:hypothetical protein